MSLTAMTNGQRPLGLRSSLSNPRNVAAALINYADVVALGTYNIFDLPARSFVVDCWFVVETAWTSAGSATMQIDESSGSGTYITTTVGAKANLTAGSVIKGGIYVASGISILGNVLGHNDEYDTSARTVDFTTGTAIWTAGVGVLIVEYFTLPAEVDS